MVHACLRGKLGEISRVYQSRADTVCFGRSLSRYPEQGYFIEVEELGPLCNTWARHSYVRFFS